jgi:phytanoyl-CoA hydroxylase
MSYLKSGYQLEKSFLDVSEVKRSIEKIFCNYCKLNNHEICDDFDSTLIELFKKDNDGFVGCAKLCQTTPELISLSVSPAMIMKLKELGLKNPVVNTRPLLSFSSRYTAKNEDYWKLPAHQDWYSTQGSLNGITCWMPLVDVPEELGPLEMCSGSHLCGPLPSTEDFGIPVLLTDKFEFLSLPMNKNDAVFFSNFTVHRSGNNSTSNRIRISAHFRFDDADEPIFIKRKYPKHKVEMRASGNLMKEFPMSNYLEIFNPTS